MISRPIIWYFFHVEIENSTQGKIFQWITLMKRMLNTLLPMEGNDSEPDHNINAVLDEQSSEPRVNMHKEPLIE